MVQQGETLQVTLFTPYMYTILFGLKYRPKKKKYGLHAVSTELWLSMLIKLVKYKVVTNMKQDPCNINWSCDHSDRNVEDNEITEDIKVCHIHMPTNYRRTTNVFIEQQNKSTCTHKLSKRFQATSEMEIRMRKRGRINRRGHSGSTRLETNTAG